jgi:hypothetical protein
LEYGGVLIDLVLSLRDHYTFCEAHNITLEKRFDDILIEMVSTRPLVCIEALDSDVHFRELTVQTLYSEFSRLLKERTPEPLLYRSPVVSLSVNESSKYVGSFTLPLFLLQSICVVLSICGDRDGLSDRSSIGLSDISDVLLRRDGIEADDTKGLAGATLQENGAPAIDVEHVSLNIET